MKAETEPSEELLEISRLMAENRALDPLLKYALSVALELVGAEYGYLVLLESDGSLDFRVKRNKEGQEIETPEEQISYSVFGKAIKNRESLLIGDALQDAEFQEEESILFLQPRSLMCTPLITEGIAMGAIYVESRTAVDIFDGQDLKLLENLAAQTAVAIQNAILNEKLKKELAERTQELQDTLERLRRKTRQLEKTNRKLEREIAGRKQVEKRLQHEASHDPLTGLANRALFMEQVRRAMERAKRQEGYLFAVLFLDLDRFKNVNDSLGHTLGDQLLVAIARRLTMGLRAIDTVARLGGDEFGVFLDNIKAASNAMRAANRVQKLLGIPFYLSGHKLFISASVGITIGRMQYESAVEILRDADIAMYHAKERGRDRYEIFDKAMHTRAVTRLQLETDLRQAIDQEEFGIHYQPIMALEGERIVGFEALVRWNHPERGAVSLEEFIPVAEETGMIVPVDRWVLYEASSQMKAWQEGRSAEERLMLTVNLSGVHFTRLDLVQGLGEILEETELDASQLGLEITESVLMENAEFAARMLSQLKALGVQLQVDDFGTGYSSLRYLHRFPIDVVKIDRSFVSGMDKDANNAAIVRTIIMLAHNLGMEVIAEGVEKEEEKEQLKTMGCEYVQGYLFSEPVAGSAAQALIGVRR